MKRRSAPVPARTLRIGKAILFAAAFLQLGIPGHVLGHHSSIALYDKTVTDFEIAGTITEIRWRNPHIRVMVEVTNDDGSKDLWRVELNDPQGTESRGVTKEMLAVGEFVRVTGSPGRGGKKIMFGGTKFTLADGRVVGEAPPLRAPASPGGIPEYGDGPKPFWAVVEPRRTDGRSDIFTVWVAPPTFDNNVESGVWGGDIELTEEARAVRDAYDPITGHNPFLSCTRGVPEIMTGFGPLDFVQVSDDEILLRFEEFDTYRTIHMGPDAEKNRPPKSPDTPYGEVGYSTGHWENENTLVMKTTGMNFPAYDQSGLPQHWDAEITERWTIINDGNQLRYELTVNDPKTFVKPVVQTKTWNWSSTQKVKPYECDPTQEQ